MNLQMLISDGEGKPDYPEKNQQQTQTTHDTKSGNRTCAALVGGECSYYCAMPALSSLIVIQTLYFMLSPYFSVCDFVY